MATGEMKGGLGGYRNFRIRGYCSNLLIEGSLAKFYFGNNLYTLNIRQTQEAIEQLSDELHLYLSKASISRIDFGANFILTHPVNEYLLLLGAYKDYLPVKIGNESKYYWPRVIQKPRPRELCFYDKIKESNHNNILIPQDLMQTNILRYEYKLKGRLARQLEIGAITGQSLWQPDFFFMMGNIWAENYFEIEKKNILRPESMDRIRTVSDARDTLLAMLIVNDDKGLLEAFLRALKEQGVFPDPKYLSRLKRKLKEINLDVTMMDVHELIKELNHQVEETVEKYREP